MTDASVLAAIATMVANDPNNLPLRLHLADLLLADGQAEAAHTHVSAVLEARPDDTDALALCTRVAKALPALEPPRRPESAGAERSERVVLRLVEGNRVDPEAVLDDDPPASPVTLKDVAGMEAVKRRLNLAFLAPLRNPELRRTFGKSLRGGLLLYGPPGCGKTFLARATAGELGAKFMPVGISDVLDMYLGQSEQNLKGYFEAARRQAPCVLFFDEVDALGRKRSLMRHSAGSGVISQFLSELDGMQSDNRSVFVLAATNHPWDVDAALRRPGRLDRMLLVLPPDASAREAILRASCRNRPMSADIDYAWIAARCEDYSGADVAHLCEAAVELAIEASLDAPEPKPVTMDQFKRAMKDVRPSIRPWLETAKNYALFANDGGVYDDLLEYLRARKVL
jgi:SpoVK/Ycf46/Vps4 family AAA+-type ATPase